jgi:pimeloyl-ACP methyl ester carboxylesterase
MSATWGWVQSRLGRLTRVCSYDRAGLGWSEAGDLAYDPSGAIDELHLLLEHAGETRPYVLVGDEFGAALATAYAARYRADLTALVLIDPPAQGDERHRLSLTRFSSTWPWLARAGVLRGTALMSRRAGGLPGASAGALSAFLNRPDHLTRAASEVSRWDDTLRLAAAAPLSPGLPVRRVTLEGSGAPEQAFRLNDQGQALIASSAIARIVEAARNAP